MKSSFFLLTMFILLITTFGAAQNMESIVIKVGDSYFFEITSSAGTFEETEIFLDAELHQLDTGTVYEFLIDSIKSESTFGSYIVAIKVYTETTKTSDNVLIYEAAGCPFVIPDWPYYKAKAEELNNFYQNFPDWSYGYHDTSQEITFETSYTQGTGSAENPKYQFEHVTTFDKKTGVMVKEDYVETQYINSTQSNQASITFENIDKPNDFVRFSRQPVSSEGGLSYPRLSLFIIGLTAITTLSHKRISFS